MQYWVGDFFVDLSRNQITQHERPQTIAPKALAVLTYLAENQGKVVSQDALLTKIWEGTAVTPNTLQRSIAQLRKALGDDGKVQRYIKTHAKQGYSLECDVRWLDGIASPQSDQLQERSYDDNIVVETSRDARGSKKSKFSGSFLKWVVILVGLLIVGFLGTYDRNTTNIAPLTFDTLRSITATDDKEFDATYSPDGKYIVFHRYLDRLCVNKLWAKDRDTQQEIQLTKDWGSYDSNSFSKDGKTLVFLETEDCDKPACYNLMRIDFEKALEEPQEPSLILQCKNSKIRKPIWLDNDHIALLQKRTDRWKIIRYSVRENRSVDLYTRDDGNIVDFAYSDRDDLIAVVSVRHDHQYYLEMLERDGTVLSDHLIEVPPEVPKYRPIYPTFHPLKSELLFSTGRQLFTLSYDGKVSKLGIPFADRMMGPTFHPDGSRMLLIKGPYDSDVVRLPRDQLVGVEPLTEQAQPFLNIRTDYPSFERSTLGEDYAMFQPNGSMVSFWSERSGGQQVWISDGEGPRALTRFPVDTYIRGLDWAEDGMSLLINANSTLTQVNLDSSQRSYPLESPVIRLFQWDSIANSALVLIRIDGITKFVEYDLSNLTYREILDRSVKWALKSEDGRLIYKDHLNQFWQPGPAEAQHIEQLDDHGDRADTFVIHDNIIYAMNSRDELWSYDLRTNTFSILGEVRKEVDYLTDINQNELLMTVQISAKKGVVELSSRD